MRSKQILLTAALAIMSAFTAHTANAQTVTTQAAKAPSLESQIAVLQTQVAGLQRLVATLQQSSVFALAPFVRVDVNPKDGVIGPNVVFSGVNIHIQNGAGATYLANGLGNLIIGYDEFPGPLDEQRVWRQGDRSGSHNLVLGGKNRFTNLSVASIVTGFENIVDGPSGMMLGGAVNVDSGQSGAIIAGEFSYIAPNVGLSILIGGSYNSELEASSVLIGGYDCKDTVGGVNAGNDGVLYKLNGP